VDNNQIQVDIKELQYGMVVMAHIEARQTDRLLRQEKETEDLALPCARTEQIVRRLQEESATFQPSAAKSKTWPRLPTNSTG
jgi:hypothetical protein